MENIRNHKNWIDFLKGIAIIAVVVDHLNGTLYTNYKIGYASFYSVTLFVFLAGITSFLSMQKRDIKSYDLNYILKRLKSFLMPYSIATAIYVVYMNKFFDISVYLKTLFGFTAAGPFYFVLFFAQIIIISPILYIILCRIRTMNNSFILNLLITVGGFWISNILIKYTFILPVHGGGKFLLGGTYLPVFYMGMLFISYKSENRNKLREYLCLALSSILLIIYYPVLWGLADPNSKISLIKF